jgi:hypothetical protein
VLDPKIDIRGIDEMQRQLTELSKRSVPYAARETLNSLAFEGRKIWQGEMRASLTLRNQFTERRALVEPARNLRMSTMEAKLGHTEEYMRLLEEGKPERADRRWRAIPTEVAAGQAKGSLSGGRKRAVRRANIIRTLGNLKAKGFSGRSRKAQNARAVGAAIKSGKRLALLDFGRRKGIYKIMGGKRRPKVVKLYDLSRRVTPMPKIPTLQRTLDQTLQRGPAIAYEALERQLARLR